MAWLTNNRLKPVNKPINKITSLGPYLSRAQPLTAIKIAQNIIFAEYKLEVAALVSSNSLARDLKNTPKERRIPPRVPAKTRQATTITQP